MKLKSQVTQYIQQASENQIPILESLRQLVHENVPNVSEAIKWKMPVFSQSKNFAYMRYAKNHITFGFTYRIPQLQDPDKLLEGEGNTTKHIKITTLDPQLEEQIIQWLKQITD